MKVFVIILIIFCSAPSVIASQTIELGYIEFPPAFFTNDAGKPEGTLIDIWRKVAEKAGYQWNATSYPTQRMVRELVAGRIHLWIGLATLPAFEGNVLVGDSEIQRITLRAYTLGKRPPVLKKEDLRGKTITIMRGYSYGGWLDFIKDPVNKIRSHKVDNHVSGFRMLKTKRVEYLLNYAGPSEEALKKITVPNLNFNQISSFGSHFVVSKKAPDAKKMLERLENAYKQLTKD